MLLTKKSQLISFLLICLIAVGTLALIDSASAYDTDYADVNAADANCINAEIKGTDDISINDNDIASNNFDISTSCLSDLKKNNTLCSSLSSVDEDGSVSSSSNPFDEKNSFNAKLKESNENIFYVSNNGNDSNSGLSSEDAFLTISNALNNINPDSDSIIYLSEGSYSELSVLDFGGNVSIIGAGINKTFLDGENTHRIAVINNTAVRFENISFVNGFDSLCGGAIYNEGDLTLINCVFSENRVFSGDKFNRSPYSYGAALYSLGNLNIEKVLFENNTLGDRYNNLSYGGVIYSEGLLSVNNSVFRANKVKSYMNWETYSGNFDAFQKGGSIYSICDNLLISNSRFEDTYLDGISIYPYNHHPNFHSFTQAAAVYFEGNSAVFYNCDFINNSADNGGAVWFKGNNTCFDSCRFINNSAMKGTALMTIDYNAVLSRNLSNKFANLTIRNSVFEHNHILNLTVDEIHFLESYGAAAYLKIDNVYVLNSSFVDNGLVEGYLSYMAMDVDDFAHSGAVFLCGQNSTVENSTFIKNRAEIGGAIYSYGYGARIIGSSFVNNSACVLDGGAIFHSIGDMIVDYCSFDGNTAIKNGGDIYASYNFANENLFLQKTVYNNSVFLNSNADYGGAIFDTGNSIIFENLTFINNSASYGGAIYKQGFSNSYRNSTFINNSASFEDFSNGGAIYNYGSNVLVDSCNFVNNSADLEGGAIFNFGESSLIINNSFDRNRAFKGGSVYLSGTGGRFQENSISSSFAVNGGGLYNANANLICLNNTFSDCSANISGGAIYNLVSTLELYANSMKNCKANLSGVGSGNYVFTCGNISYLVVSFANNGSFNIVDNKTVVLIAMITDNMGNPITGGNFSFILFNKSVSNSSDSDDDISGDSGSDSAGSGSVYGGSDSAGSGSVDGGSDGADDSGSDGAGSGSDGAADSTNDSTDDSNSNSSSASNAESTIIGISEVIEGRATMTYSLTLELGTSYVISGTYSFGAEPISTQMGSLNSVLSTQIYFASNLFDSKLVYGDNLTYEMILLDSQNEYIPNAEILVYLDGVYTKSVFTNEVGYLNDTISNILIQGSHLYTFIYEGDIFHNRFAYDLDFEAFYNNTHIFDDVILSFTDLVYSIVKTLPDNEIAFGFALSHEDGEPLGEVSTPRYFRIYENGETLKGSSFRDYLGDGIGVDCLYYILVLFGHPNKIYQTDSDGSFSMFVNKTEPGLYEYTICFMGDLVKHYDSTTHNHISEADNYYNPCNISFILLVDNPDADIVTYLNFTSEDAVTEIDFPYYSFNLRDSDNNPLSDKEIRIYDNGSYIGSSFTDYEGAANFRFPNMLDLGRHLIEFVYAGDENYSGTYKILDLEVLENPRKDDVIFYNKTPLSLFGPDKNLTVQLKDYYNNNLTNSTVNIELFFNPADFETFDFGGFDKNTYSIGENDYAYTKNFTLITDENGLFTVPLELGAGNYKVHCSYDGNKWYRANERTFNLNLSKVQTLLFGQSSINVLKNESYLVVVLSTNDLNVLNNSKIRYIVLSEDDNISLNSSLISNASIRQLSSYLTDLPNYYASFYAFTNESSISKLRISLPVGKYSLFTVFEGDKWYNGSSLLTNLSVFGELSKLETGQNTIIKKPGYYSVKLLDSNNNPIQGQIVTIYLDNETYTRYTDINGEARLEIDLDYGNYTVVSQFKGNINYSSSYVISNLLVVDEDYKYPSVLKVISSSIYREKGKYQVLLSGVDNEMLADRTVIINVNGSNHTVKTDNDGIADLDYNFTLGSYRIISYFEGDGYYQKSNISFILTVVDKDAANTVLNSSIYWVFKGKDNVYTVTLQDKLQYPIAGETVFFTINSNQEFYAVTDIGGNANLIINLDPGSYNIDSYFRGSDVYFSSTCFSKVVVLPLDNETNGSNVINSSNASSGIDAGSDGGNSSNASSGTDGGNSTGSGSDSNITNSSSGTVNSTNSSTSNAIRKSKISTKIIANNLVKYYKNGKNLIICLKTSDNKVLPGKYLSVTINGKTYKGATDKNGKIYLVVNLKKASYNVKIKFAGDKTYKASSKKVTVKVVLPTIKAVKTTVKKGKKLQILFKNYKGGLIKNQKVSIKIKGKTYTLKTNSKGIASLSLKLKKGTYTVSAGLKNTDLYGKYTKSFKIRVN